MHPRAEEFKERAFKEHGIEIDVHEFPEGTKTAREAAEAVGCDVAQIAKSVLFVADNIVVVLASGNHTVDEDLLAETLGVESVRTAEPDEVKETLGWSIGGVPPFCHDTDVPVILDPALKEYNEVWSAAGTPNAVFPIEPGVLVDAADAEISEVIARD